jgi:hypothetical protein
MPSREAPTSDPTVRGYTPPRSWVLQLIDVDHLSDTTRCSSDNGGMDQEFADPLHIYDA